MAVDYDTIIANAMTNQSATFDQVPRSLMNPTPGEQALYDQGRQDLQWAGNDIEGAKQAARRSRYRGHRWRRLARIQRREAELRRHLPQRLVRLAGCDRSCGRRRQEIGIDITTNYPEWSVYQTVVTKSDAPLPEGYDIFMMWSDGAGPTSRGAASAS
jgi:peptide/nickel transport system substrate-binding protein